MRGGDRGQTDAGGEGAGGKGGGAHGGEDFGDLLEHVDARPVELAEEPELRRVLEVGGRMRAEEGGEALAVAQRRRAAPVRDLRTATVRVKATQSLNYSS